MSSEQLCFEETVSEHAVSAGSGMLQFLHGSPRQMMWLLSKRKSIIFRMVLRSKPESSIMEAVIPKGLQGCTKLKRVGDGKDVRKRDYQGM